MFILSSLKCFQEELWFSWDAHLEVQFWSSIACLSSFLLLAPGSRWVWEAVAIITNGGCCKWLLSAQQILPFLSIRIARYCGKSSSHCFHLPKPETGKHGPEGQIQPSYLSLWPLGLFLGNTPKSAPLNSAWIDGRHKGCVFVCRN